MNERSARKPREKPDRACRGTDTHAEGIIVLDRQDELIFASGLGADERLKALVLDHSWLASAKQRRLLAVDIEGKRLSLSLLPYREGLLLVVSSIPDLVFDFISAVDFAYHIVEHMVGNPFDAMTVVDADAAVKFIPPVHETFFGLKRGGAVGKPVRQVIENTGLDRVVLTGRAEIGELQRMRGRERIVERIPILKDGRILGAIGRVMFKGPAEVEAMNKRILSLTREVEFYRRQASALRPQSGSVQDIVGESPTIRRLKAEIIKIAPLDVSVLIQGESGTGKDLIARALHQLSPRRDASYVTVNAAALPATLVESELFGYEPGAFTGADRKGRKGKFEIADGGSIFLDEIGDMPLEVQAKLLRVLQDRLIERIGGSRSREVDFRLFTATNRNLQQHVREERFRLDLYYRISAIILEVPPLRHRLEDIPLLVDQFLAEFCARYKRPIPEISDGVLDYLLSKPWHGNVRELRHEVERAAIFSEQNRLTPEDFMHGDDLHFKYVPTPPLEPTRMGTSHESLHKAIERVEDEMIREAIRNHAGNKKRAAESLGISRSYLYKRLNDLT